MNWKDVEGSSHDLIKVHSWHFLGGTDEKHGNISQDYQRPAKIQIQACPEYVSTAILLHKSVQAHMQLVLAARQKWTAHFSCQTRNQSATTVHILSLYCHLAKHRNHRSPTHSLPGCILWPAATSVNRVYTIEITIIFGSQVHHLLVFFHMCPTNQPIINGMALCHKKLETHDVNKCLKITVLILCLASHVLNSKLLLVANAAIFLVIDEVRMKYLQHCQLCGSGI